ncbi:ROK family protein [Pseudactinotalea sp. Z1748]|uniref:ROK family protein n=1 Tax=Pseudactinotalea sp. Z1748 TaxID=3413027 RepID=UPI003C7D9216
MALEDPTHPGAQASGASGNGTDGPQGTDPDEPASSANGPAPTAATARRPGATGSLPVRRINLSTLMRLVHTRGPLSRADLTRATGLNRSTVGVLLAELSDHGRVVAGKPAPGRAVGRPSPLIHAAPGIAAITVYPDADALDVAVVSLTGKVTHRIRRAVAEPPTPEQTVALTAQIIDEFALDPGRVRPLGVGMAVPGLVRARDGFVHMAPHLPWRDVPIAELMRAGTDLPTWAGNDATLGTDAEAIFGAGRGAGTLVYLHGGSGGIGSGVRLGRAGARGGADLLGEAGAPVEPGAPDAARADGGAYLPELGHLMVNSEGVRCHCGAVGCLETEVNLARLRGALPGRELPEGSRASELAEVLNAAGGIELPEVARQIGFLATGIRNSVNAFAPDLVLLGGFLGTLFDVAPRQLTSMVRDQLMPPLAAVQIRRGTLGSERIHIGAAEAVFEPLLRDPLGDHRG